LKNQRQTKIAVGGHCVLAVKRSQTLAAQSFQKVGLFVAGFAEPTIQLRQSLLQRTYISWIRCLKLAQIFFVDVSDRS
jgi:hypothetical protein